MAGAYTVDASVTLKLVVQEADSDLAQTLFDHLTDEVPVILYVPCLLYVECANSLWKYIVRYGYDTSLAQLGLQYITQLNLITVTTRILVQTALELARAYRISAYDAVYLSLSQATGTDLITADDRLVHKLSKRFPSVRSLRDGPF